MKGERDMTMNPRRDIFNVLAETWDERIALDAGKTDTIRSVIASVSIQEGDHVLDVGCGTGVLTPYIVPYLGDTGLLTGIDVSERMIEQASRKFSFRNVRFVHGDIYDHPFAPQSFDSIFVFSTFPHLHDKELSLRIFHDALKPHGTLCIFHLEGSSQINDFHRKHTQNEVLQNDRLPSLPEMRRMIDEAQWEVTKSEDREGLYLLLLRKVR